MTQIPNYLPFESNYSMFNFISTLAWLVSHPWFNVSFGHRIAKTNQPFKGSLIFLLANSCMFPQTGQQPALWWTSFSVEVTSLSLQDWSLVCRPSLYISVKDLQCFDSPSEMSMRGLTVYAEVNSITLEEQKLRRI